MDLVCHEKHRGNLKVALPNWENMIQVTNGRCEVERARLSACKCAFKLMACLAECPTSTVGLIRALCYFKRLSRVAFMSLCCSLWNVGGWSLSPTPACDSAQCSPLPFLPVFQTKMTFLSNANKKKKKTQLAWSGWPATLCWIPTGFRAQLVCDHVIALLHRARHSISPMTLFSGDVNGFEIRFEAI